MSWQERLLGASWRGVAFLTERHEATAGQRLVVHELPGRNVPVVEDLGAKAGSWRVTAYFLGADYDVARDRLLAALAVPGADWLQHPWLGRLWVRAQDWSTTESNESGGLATVSVTFVEGGGGVLQPRVDLVDVAQARTADFLDGATNWSPPLAVDAMTLQALQARVQLGLSGVRNALALARLPLTMLAAVTRQIDSALELLREGLALQGEYARALRSISGALLMADVADDDSRVRGVAALARQAVATGGVGSGGGIGGVAQQRVLDAEAAARGRWCAAMAAQLALADYNTQAARDGALAAALEAIDLVMPQAEDKLFEAAADARSALQQSLRAQQLAITQTRVVVAPMPAAVLAYQMGVDEDLLIARNGIAHPLFVQGVVRV